MQHMFLCFMSLGKWTIQVRCFPTIRHVTSRQSEAESPDQRGISVRGFIVVFMLWEVVNGGLTMLLSTDPWTFFSFGTINHPRLFYSTVECEIKCLKMGATWDFKTPVHWVHWVPVQEKPHEILAARLAQSSSLRSQSSESRITSIRCRDPAWVWPKERPRDSRSDLLRWKCLG